jgi:DnaJ-class molecular chaperone
MAADHYQTLGLSRGASAEDIKRAWRKLAREHHPDLHPDDPAAPERLKAVNRAYEVLGDPEKRKMYDEFGEQAEQLGFDPERVQQARAWRAQGGPGGFAGFGQGADVEDLLSQLFGRGGRGPRGPQPGADLRARLRLDFRTAALGGERELDLGQGPVKVRIPAGIRPGGTLRLRGRGAPGSPGAPAGDLLVEIDVVPDPLFQREGDDLKVEVPITLGEAMSGAQLEVPTLTGPVRVRVPPGVQPGQTLRVRGRGVHPPKGAAGDLLVRLQVVLPETRGQDVSAALDALEALYTDDVRASLRPYLQAPAQA